MTYLVTGVDLAFASMAGTAVLVLTAAAFTTGLNAMTLRQLCSLVQSDENGATYALHYMVSAMEGALEAHMHDLRHSTAPSPSYASDGGRLEPRMTRTLLDSELQRNPGIYEADMPVQFVMTARAAQYLPLQDRAVAGHVVKKRQ